MTNAAIDIAGLKGLRHIALIGNSLPRRCGIATYTTDIVNSLRARFPELRVDVFAMDDLTGVTYANDVNTIAANDPQAYRHAAALIEASGAQAIWLQHEFGIFGGSAGEHILGLLERSTLPVVATLHTVLENPNQDELRVFERLLARASQLIVMAECGARLLETRYGVDPSRITVIPHGVPDRPYVDPAKAKAKFGLQNRKVIMTFGLLAPDKGIRHMIEAMPEIVVDHSDACYVIIGATHPNLVRHEGEALRDSLRALARTLGVEDRIRFVDTFLEQDELLDWLESADVYVTPYLNLQQVTSGTLSYAVSLGKPVVSTPYIHAREILADGHGVIVPPRDSGSLADALGMLLSDDAAREAMAAKAYALGRQMLWPRAMERSVALIERARSARSRQIGPAAPAVSRLSTNLAALRRMTDATGMLQHGIFSVPDRRHGYCIDDNARALILACRAGPDADADGLASTYAAFMQHAWNPDTNRFRNFMHFDRTWCEEAGSEDSNGRTLWALGVAAAEGRPQAMRDWAIHLFGETRHISADLHSPRARAFAALGAAELLTGFPSHDGARAMLAETGELLTCLLAEYRRPGWSWFEPVLAYDNARLPEALIRIGLALRRPGYTRLGLETLEWLTKLQTGREGCFRPVGVDSFGREYADPLPFDQQPLEAQATIDACVAAHAATGDRRWIEEAERAYGWFMGRNDLGLPLVSREDGGCYDGLMPHGLNRNQGAESILALQLSNVAMSALSFGEQAVTKTRGAA